MSAPFGHDASLDISVDQHPISQTPCQALRTKHFVINYILTILVNFGINLGIAALVMIGYDRAGLWASLGMVVDENNRRQYYTDTALWLDLLLTAFAVTFFMSVLTTVGSKKAMITADALPIPSQELKVWKVFGLTITSNFYRGLILALWSCLTVYPVTLGILAALCKNGQMEMHAPESACYISVNPYKYMKGVWCGLVALCIYPLVYMASLNRDTLTTEEWEAFFAANENKHSHQAKLVMSPNGVYDNNAGHDSMRALA